MTTKVKVTRAIFFSYEEVAAIMKARVATVRTWAHKGQLKKVKFGKRAVVSRSELIRFLEEKCPGLAGELDHLVMETTAPVQPVTSSDKLDQAAPHVEEA
jgi:excisionase family DNA binding protein